VLEHWNNSSVKEFCHVYVSQCEIISDEWPCYGVNYFDATLRPICLAIVLGIIETIFRRFKGPRVYISRAEGRPRRWPQGSNPLTTPRLYRKTPPWRTPQSCLERENDPRPRSNSVDRVLGHQGLAGRNLNTRSTRCGRDTELAAR